MLSRQRPPQSQCSECHAGRDGGGIAAFIKGNERLLTSVPVLFKSPGVGIMWHVLRVMYYVLCGDKAYLFFRAQMNHGITSFTPTPS